MSESATPTTQNDIPTWFDTQKRTSFAASPINTATPHENHRLETRHVEASKRALRKDFLQFSHFVASESTFSYEFSRVNLKICYLKIDVSCEASINFQRISQNATPATVLALCHHLRQPWQCDSQKTRNATPLKCCACHAKWRWRSRDPKCCTCHEDWNSSSENVAKILRLPRKKKICLNGTRETSKSDPCCRTCHGH